MKDTTINDPALAYWAPFLDRFKKIPVEYQQMILDEYEEAEKQCRDLDPEKMWKILAAGESDNLPCKKLGN